MADHDALTSASAASTEMRRSVPMEKYRSLPLRIILYAVSRLTRYAWTELVHAVRATFCGLSFEGILDIATISVCG